MPRPAWASGNPESAPTARSNCCGGRLRVVGGQLDEAEHGERPGVVRLAGHRRFRGLARARVIARGEPELGGAGQRPRRFRDRAAAAFSASSRARSRSKSACATNERARSAAGDEPFAATAWSASVRASSRRSPVSAITDDSAKA